MSIIFDKVYVCRDGVSTFPLAHYLTSDRDEIVRHGESLGDSKLH